MTLYADQTDESLIGELVRGEDYSSSPPATPSDSSRARCRPARRTSWPNTTCWNPVPNATWTRGRPSDPAHAPPALMFPCVPSLVLRPARVMRPPSVPRPFPVAPSPRAWTVSVSRRDAGPGLRHAELTAMGVNASLVANPETTATRRGL